MARNPNRNQKDPSIPLNLICDAIESADNDWKQYLDIETMEIISLPECPFTGEYDQEDQELADRIEEGWNIRYFGLPSTFDIHEYSIMEDFVYDLPEGKVQNALENAIRGKGAFRRFKDAIYKFGIEEQWYDFQEEKYRKIAREWCEAHGFTYSDSEQKDAADFTQKETAAQNSPAVTKERQKDAENLTWEEISREHIVQDEWIDFRRSAYRFPDGSVFEPFYSYSRRDYVVIVASDEEGNYLCVRQFRQGIREVTTEFPAGGIERTEGREYRAEGDKAPGEDALEAARRELLEETGYVSEKWTHLLTVPGNATLADNYAYVFRAENCRRTGTQNLDETEFLNVRPYSAEKIEELIRQGKFQQAVHIMAWLLAQRS